MNKRQLFGILLGFGICLGFMLPCFAEIGLPTLSVGMQQPNSPKEFSQGVQILILLTILTLAPSILVMTTSFTRIVIVLALTRQAIGTSTLPPNQVLVSLALILTFFVMAPTFNKINENAFQPYMNNKITQEVAIERSIEPLRDFMLRYTEEKELGLFITMSKIDKSQIKEPKDTPTYILLPAFIITELKTAFKIGFMIFIPFLVIDIVVSSILVAMGMMFLPPSIIATPFKIILFVMIDGWYLITKALLEGFMV
ncbi:MAG: flagellar type III secretion system pore protein FliP [Candidatus Gastranaerophilales bacterium]|nr:flagellar type III secretion system pore protein FliP [Candidatus Gastranaerophilales bacterium]